MIGPVKDGSLEKTLAVAEKLGVRDRITIIPGVPKDAVPAEISSGDIFLNTTNVDNQPVSVLEAMACGLCVVSTNVGGLPYVVEDGVDGLLCAPNDAEAMIELVRQVLMDTALAARISVNARVRAEQCGWATILPQWEDIFQRVVT